MEGKYLNRTKMLPPRKKREEAFVQATPVLVTSPVGVGVGVGMGNFVKAPVGPCFFSPGHSLSICHYIFTSGTVEVVSLARLSLP